MPKALMRPKNENIGQERRLARRQGTAFSSVEPQKVHAFAGVAMQGAAGYGFVPPLLTHESLSEGACSAMMA